MAKSVSGIMCGFSCRLNRLALPQQIVTVCDREAAIYELFQDANNHQHDFIVRVARNRRVEDLGSLYETLGQIVPVAIGCWRFVQELHGDCYG